MDAVVCLALALAYTAVFLWRLMVEWFDEPMGIDRPYRGYFRALLWPLAVFMK